MRKTPHHAIPERRVGVGCNIQLESDVYTAVFGGPLVGYKGAAFSLPSTCILLYSEVPSMHSDFCPCLWACVFVDLRVGATRPTTLFYNIRWGNNTQAILSTDQQALCLAAGLPSRILPEHARPRLALMLHWVGSWHAQTPSDTTFVLKLPSSGQATMAQAKFN